MTNSELGGKTVVITGASRGIGEAAAKAFIAAGANVVMAARNVDAIDALAAQLGPKARAVACDVADPDAVNALIHTAISTFGSVDVLIGNAGTIGAIGDLGDITPADFGRTIDVNLKGVFYGINAVLPHMVARGSGTIITVSSGAAHGPMEGWASYCTSKAGAFMLTRAADHEYREKGIRVLGLSPGTVATQMQRDIKGSGYDNVVSRLDWSDHIPPEWPAKALVWMCSAQADAHLGTDVSLRDEGIRRSLELI